MRQVAFLDVRVHLKVDPFKATYEGCDHATGEASCEARAHNRSRRRNGTWYGRTGSFAGGERIRARDTHC